MKLSEVKVTSTDTDMTNIVTRLKGEGVKAIAADHHAGPDRSAAAANKALGLNVPMLGNNPVSPRCCSRARRRTR